MPVPTLDRIKTREASLKKRIADKGESMAADELRAWRKRLRRTQRRRRRMAAHLARIAPKAAPDAAEAPADASAE